MRIAGITIPDNKRLEIGLTSVYGIGRSRAQDILDKSKVAYGKKSSELTPEEENSIRKIVETLKIEGDLKREVSSNIKRLKDIKSYRGTRHDKRMPSRGQRTRSNARTKRGKRVTIGAMKKDDRVKTDSAVAAKPAEKK